MTMTAKGKYIVISAAAAILLALCLILTSANAKAQSVPEQKTIVAAPGETQTIPPVADNSSEADRVCAGRPLATLVLAAQVPPETLERMQAEAALPADPETQVLSDMPEASSDPAGTPAEKQAIKAEASSSVIKTSVPLEKAAANSISNYEQHIATISNTDPELFASENSEVKSGTVPENLELLDTFIATAYCDYGLTATGTTTTVGRTIAVNPDDIPYGTHVWLFLDDGTFVGDYYAEDTGGNLLRQHYIVDIYMGADSYEQCINWGARHVSIYIDPNE